MFSALAYNAVTELRLSSPAACKPTLNLIAPHKTPSLKSHLFHKLLNIDADPYTLLHSLPFLISNPYVSFHNPL
jgi:hypothetical protein